MTEVRRSLTAMNEQVSWEDLVNKLQTLNEETRSVLDDRAEALNKMIWTRQILEHLCKDHRWNGTEETLQVVWRRYCRDE